MNNLSAFFIISALFECAWMPLSINLFIDKKIGALRRIIFSIICGIGYMIPIFFNGNEWTTLIYFPLIVLAIYFVLEKRLVLFLLVPMSYVIVLNSHYLFEKFNENVLGKNFDLVSFWYGIPYNCLKTVVIILITLMIRELIKLIRGKVSLFYSKEMMIFCILLIVLCTVVCLITNWHRRRATGAEGVYVFILLVGIRVVYGKEVLKRKEEENRNIMEYTKHVEEMYDELRSFRHDYVNILASLSGYIERNDMPGLREYFEENIMPTNERMNQGRYRLQKLSKLQNSAIKGLVSNKIIYAMNQGIDVFVDLMDEVKDIAINTIDLCRVLGIYMDNAIEAANECDNKEIKFNVIKEDNSVTFVIMNSFVNHGLSLSDMEKQNVSSKGEGRGLGLNNVKEILSRYNNVNKVTEIKDNYFIQTLIIDNKAA